MSLATVFGAGLLTLISPCVLPLIPIYLGMLLGSSLEAVQEPGGRARLLAATLAFSLGFALVFTLLGLGASSLGGLIHTHRQTLLWVGGLLILIFGLKFLGVLRLPFLETERRFRALRTGHRLLDASLFGVVFALGWTPCVGPILGTVLTYTAARTTEPLQGALFLAVYSAGLALPLLALGFASDRLLPLLRRVGRHLPAIERATGLGLAGVGLWLIFSSGSVPTTDPDIPPGPAVREDGQAITPWLGLPSPQPRLVEFFTQSCPSCKVMAPRVAALEQDCAGQRIEIVKVDAGDPRNRQVVERFKVSAVPTFSLLAPDGREVQRLLGEHSLERLREAAAGLIEASCGGVEPRGPADEQQPQPASGGQPPCPSPGS